MTFNQFLLITKIKFIKKISLATFSENKIGIERNKVTENKTPSSLKGIFFQPPAWGRNHPVVKPIQL